MCHGCVYTGSFVLDYHVLYLQHFMFIEWKSHIELFQNGLFHELYHFKALTSLEQLITSVVEKKKTIVMNKTSRLLENQDRRSRIG